MYKRQHAGRLENVLWSLARYYDEEDRLYAKIKNAIAYPAALLCVMSAILLFTVIVILPVFVDVYHGLTGNLTAGSFGYVNASIIIGWIALGVTLLCTVLVVLEMCIRDRPSIALFRSTVGFLRFIAEKLDGDDALPLRDKRNVAIRHNHAGNTGRINISRIFIFPSRKDIPISRGIRNEGDAGVYLLNGRFVLGSTIRKSATVGLIRQYLRVGDITRIERG